MRRNNHNCELYDKNFITAQQTWNCNFSPLQLEQLKVLSERYEFSVSAGDLLMVDGRWYVTHTGLLRLATRKRCSGIHVRPVMEFCDAANCRWAFEATVYRSRSCRGFIGYGDADLANTSPVVRGSEMRVAETRAVNRALRKAYGIGVCSIEEVGSAPRPEPPAQVLQLPVIAENSNGNGHRLRNQIFLLIRKHKLDAGLVKLYAVDYCGVNELRQATREQIEAFTKHLAEYAEKDHAGLICELNSYGTQTTEAA
jgi:hypothetical protein